MSTKHKRRLVRRQDLSPSLTTKVFVGLPRKIDTEKVKHTFIWNSEVGNNIPDSTTDRVVSISINTPSTLSDIILYEGTPFIFDNKALYLAEEITLIGGQEESLAFEVKSGISIIAAQVYTYDLVEYIPLHGINRYDWKYNGNAVEGVIFSGGTTKEKMNSSISPVATMSGDRVIDDPGRDMIRSAVVTGKLIDVVIVRPLLDGGFFFVSAPIEAGEAGEAESLLTNDFELPVNFFNEFKTIEASDSDPPPFYDPDLMYYCPLNAIGMYDP